MAIPCANSSLAKLRRGSATTTSFRCNDSHACVHQLHTLACIQQLIGSHTCWHQADATAFSQCSPLLYILWSPHNRITPDSFPDQACFLCYPFSSSPHHSCELWVHCSDLIEQPCTTNVAHTSCGPHLMRTESSLVAHLLGLYRLSAAMSICMLSCSNV